MKRLECYLKLALLILLLALATLTIGFAVRALAAPPLSTSTARIMVAAYGESVEAEPGRVVFTDTRVGRCARQSPRAVLCVLAARGVDIESGVHLRCRLDVRVRQVSGRISLTTGRAQCWTNRLRGESNGRST